MMSGDGTANHQESTDFLISDLHLQASRQDLCDLFSHFMANIAPESQRLFILGDFFEYWVGDDASDDFTTWVESLLRGYSDSGRALYIGHGNRDFLLGEDFCQRTGATLLALPQVCMVGGEATLLLHGDELCTDDTEYQAFRQQVRHPDWIRQFLAMPRDAREQFARQARAQSRTQDMQTTAQDIMDVNEDAVEQAFLQHKVVRMIHGHTHRQHVHRYPDPAGIRIRVVLGDWGETGCYCQCRNGAFQLINFRTPQTGTPL